MNNIQASSEKVFSNLTLVQLLALPTKRLYNVYRGMQEHRGWINRRRSDECCWQDECKCEEENDMFVEVCDKVKSELGTREHVVRKPRKGEGK